MEWWQIVLIVLGVIGAGVYVWWLKRGRGEAHYTDLEFVMLGIDKTFRQFKFNVVTAGGVKVKSTVPVPADILPLIDAGIGRQITKHTAQYPNWTAHKNLSDYEVLIIDPMGINQETEPGSPCIFAQGYQTAGTCIGTYPRTNIKVPKIVVPHQANQSWQYREYFLNSIWFESEHVREWVNMNNDPTGIFWHYATAGDQHPHVP